MIFTHIRHNFEKAFYPRMMEWACAVVTGNFGLMFYLRPEAMTKSPVLVHMLDFASQPVWAQSLFVLGWMRLGVLLVNGAWRKSPYLRALSAMLCCFLWTQLLMAAATEGSVGLAIFPVLLGMDLINVYRSMQDARTVDDAFRGMTNVAKRPSE